ncbi:vWA domain-containing protein [Pseudoalteromonas xiamenensis]|uniref:VWA domain-containing protein n=1 Tax=Pseudoalteromonas xiamenensis TaxID=882626 RepID=A0A975HKS4_9GAMM|nr:vWA domain-containing protein [Pseudoalteromonas xiamenensis]QTH71289.1 VWA domain-containing protein [Pseudoalteromonas xiamenensis]
MRKKRAVVDGFNMSFLDVMACGLGAVILIFILVDFSGGQPPTEEETRLEQSLQSTQEKITEYTRAHDSLLAQLETIKSKLKTENAKDAAANDEQAALLNEISTQLAVVSKLEAELKAVSSIPAKESALEIQGKFAQQYLTGMKVEGKHIVVLLDKSASMMDDNLVGVLSAMALDDKGRKAKAKWQRTLRVVNWLLARVPPDSEVSLIAFSDTAKTLGQSKTINGKDSRLLNALAQSAHAVLPDGGTNLQLGLQTALSTQPSVSDIYLITDGLPTLGDGLNLRCKGLLTNKKSISSECRQQLLLETISRFKKSVHLNVILLPIEGDPYASSMYWSWTQVTGGRFLAPAQEWPQ